MARHLRSLYGSERSLYETIMKAEAMTRVESVDTLRRSRAMWRAIALALLVLILIPAVVAMLTWRC